MRARPAQDAVGGAPDKNTATASALSRVRRSGHRLLADDGDRTKWRLSSRIRLQESPKESTGILIDAHSARICRCNGSAWSMLRILENGANLDQLVEAVCAEYRIDAEAARDDALDFIARLQRAAFVDAG